MMPFVEIGNELSPRNVRDEKKDMEKKPLRNAHSHSILSCTLVYIQSNSNSDFIRGCHD